jgi:hypothetical protein
LIYGFSRAATTTVDAGIGKGNPHLDSGGFFGCYAVK